MGTVEQLEKNKVKLTFTVTPERFREGLTYSYNRNKHLTNVPGFRKGKAPRKVVERAYGKDFFYSDALDFVLPDAYESACDEHNIEPVYKPSIRLEEADEDSGATFVAEIWVKPEVTVDGYYGLTYPPFDAEPNDSDIQERLQREREKNARQVSVERPAQMGDVVTINFTGYTDGEPFEGGAGTDFELTLGSGSFIDNFEEQLTGHSVGDDVSVSVRFPDDYHHEALSGKDATFEVEILDIMGKEYPEVDDEFAQDISEFDTLAEYKEDLAKQIRAAKEQEALQHRQAHVLKQLVERAVMDVPEAMYTARVDEMMYDFEERLRMQGMSLPLYLQYLKTTEEGLKAAWAATAREDVNTALALEAVAAKENMTVSEEAFKAYVEEALDSRQNADDVISRMSPARRKEIEKSILNKQALDFVLEKAVEVEIIQ